MGTFYMAVAAIKLVSNIIKTKPTWFPLREAYMNGFKSVWGQWPLEILWKTVLLWCCLFVVKEDIWSLVFPEAISLGPWDHLLESLCHKINHENFTQTTGSRWKKYCSHVPNRALFLSYPSLPCNSYINHHPILQLYSSQSNFTSSLLLTSHLSCQWFPQYPVTETVTWPFQALSRSILYYPVPSYVMSIWRTLTQPVGPTHGHFCG